MLLIHGEQRVFFFMGLIFILIQVNGTQTTEKDFRLSDIELIPSLVIANSTSNVNVLCVNHQSDDLPLIINLSKNISKDYIRIFRYQLNKTTIHIRMQLRNYLGTFYLLCYAKNNKSKGTRADVIVKTEPGLIELTERCRVYEREYIKCIFRAPNIARAIQNDFPPDFEFIENTNLQTYHSNYEFFQNESTNEYLVFKWIPTVDGEFPNGMLMNMYIRLPYFSPLFYRFDMTPIFVIKPKFGLKKVSENKIQIQLISIFPSAICQKSITPKTNANLTQKWTKIKSTRNSTIMKNLLFDTMYQVCIRCRQASKDPQGIKNCQEIRTSKKFFTIFTIISFVIISCIILIFVILVIYRFPRNQPEPLTPDHVAHDDVADNVVVDVTHLYPTEYTLIETTDYLPPTETQTPSENRPLVNNNLDSI